MKPENWVVNPQLQMQLISAQPQAVQQAAERLYAMIEDLLLTIAMGQVVQEDGLPIGGLRVAFKSAIVQAIIFAIVNEDPRYATRMKLTQSGQSPLLVATMSPQAQAQLAQDALRREDPKR